MNCRRARLLPPLLCRLIMHHSSFTVLSMLPVSRSPIFLQRCCLRAGYSLRGLGKWRIPLGRSRATCRRRRPRKPLSRMRGLSAGLPRRAVPSGSPIRESPSVQGSHTVRGSPSSRTTSPCSAALAADRGTKPAGAHRGRDSRAVGSHVLPALGCSGDHVRFRHKVVLHGPAVFKVVSADRGYVSYGWVSVRAGKEGESRNAERDDGASKRPKPGDDLAASAAGTLPLKPTPRAWEIAKRPLFTLYTPVATVTARDARFDVAVDDMGASSTCVARGGVALQFPGARRARPSPFGKGVGPSRPIRCRRGTTFARFRFPASRGFTPGPLSPSRRWPAEQPIQKNQPWNGEERSRSLPNS